MDPQHPVFVALLTAGAAVMAKWWHDDFRAAERGTPTPNALPGATRAPSRAYVIGCGGSLVLLAVETGGEHALGISSAQSDITVLFGIYTLAAAFLEELIFRGYLVVTGRGRAALVAGAIGASVIFGLLHPFLWSWENGQLELHLTPKAGWSTAMAVAGSLWFYRVRFMPANPRQSLLPCVAAHGVKNLGVFFVKLAEGHVTGWW